MLFDLTFLIRSYTLYMDSVQWQTDYVENTCWVTGVYYWDPKSENLPLTHDNRPKYWVAYVQWVPIVFLIMAAMYHIAPIFWRLSSRQFGFAVREYSISYFYFDELNGII